MFLTSIARARARARARVCVCVCVCARACIRALINIYLYIRSPSALLDNFYVVSHHTDAARMSI